MIRYERWVDGMFEQLKIAFDSLEYWKRQKDWHLMKAAGEIRRQLGNANQAT
jgi:hypothetical protein